MKAATPPAEGWYLVHCDGKYVDRVQDWVSLGDDAMMAVMLKALSTEDLFVCDPDKNTECTKEGCYRTGGCCFLTRSKESSLKPKGRDFL